MTDRWPKVSVLIDHYLTRQRPQGRNKEKEEEKKSNKKQIEIFRTAVWNFSRECHIFVGSCVCSPSCLPSSPSSPPPTARQSDDGWPFIIYILVCPPCPSGDFIFFLRVCFVFLSLSFSFLFVSLPFSPLSFSTYTHIKPRGFFLFLLSLLSLFFSDLVQ